MSENEFYDIELNLKSISNLKEGFPIYYSEKGKKKLMNINMKMYV